MAHSWMRFVLHLGARLHFSVGQQSMPAVLGAQETGCQGYYYVRPDEQAIVDKRKADVEAAAMACEHHVGAKVGSPWMACVLMQLRHLDRERGDARIPPLLTLNPHTFAAPGAQTEGALLLDLLRNYSCARHTHGSHVLERRTWNFEPADHTSPVVPPCDVDDEDLDDTGDFATRWSFARGFLPGSDGLATRQVSIEQAKTYCYELPGCRGFTLKENADASKLPTVYFKSKALFSDVNMHPEWRTYALQYWNILPGHLTSGNTINQSISNLEEAQSYCSALQHCIGFTFEESQHGGIPMINFKAAGTAQKILPKFGWRTYLKTYFNPAPAQCSWSRGSGAHAKHVQRKLKEDLAKAATKRGSKPGAGVKVNVKVTTTDAHGRVAAREFRVDVLRKNPLAVIVHDFVTAEECSVLKQRAHALQVSSDFVMRNQYASVNFDFHNKVTPLTLVRERMFALVRDLTNLSVYSAGQENMHAFVYSADGHEHRPHCDGACDGRPYVRGSRVATTLIYCDVATRGGMTSFTRSGIMVKPKPRQLLLFSFKTSNDTFDKGLTEYSECPVRRGRKWVAAQWYREGVSHERPWYGMTHMF